MGNTKKKNSKMLFVREIEHKIIHARTEKDLDKCEEMIGKLIYGRLYLLGQITYARKVIALFECIENNFRDNPKILINQCFKHALDKIREREDKELESELN